MGKDYRPLINAILLHQLRVLLLHLRVPVPVAHQALVHQALVLLEHLALVLPQAEHPQEEVAAEAALPPAARSAAEAAAVGPPDPHVDKPLH